MGGGIERTKWIIHGERVIDENRHIRLTTVDVELPDGTTFTQYVARMPRCAMTLVLDDDRRVLLMYRHRFIVDRWVWELPGGYVDRAEGRFERSAAGRPTRPRGGLLRMPVRRGLAARGINRGGHINHGRRTVNGNIILRVPKTVIDAKCAPYLKRGKPAHWSHPVNNDDYTIVATYGAEYRGIVQYYLLAGDVWRLNRLNWVMLTSLLKTLAAKHQSSVSKMAAKYKATTETPHGPRRCFQATVNRGSGRKPLVATYGGIPLKRQRRAVLSDQPPAPATRRRELITRFLAGKCETCGRTGDTEVHQVRKLADLTTPGQPQPEWAALMTRRRRKTLIVCRRCHDAIHAR